MYQSQEQRRPRRNSVLLTRWKQFKSDGSTSWLSHDEFAATCSEMGLSSIDVRVLDNTTSHTRSSWFIVFRDQCTVVRIGTIGFVLGEDKMILHDTNHETVSFCTELIRRCSQAQHTQFIEVVLDTVLDTSLSRLVIRFEQVEAASQQLIEVMQQTSNNDAFARLKTLKKRVGEIQSQVESISKTLDKSLGAGDPEDHILEKTIFHIYLTKADSILLQVGLVSDGLNDAEDYANTMIDTQRNQILRFELLMLTFSFATSVVSAVSGLLGMNLDNAVRFPNSSNSFLITCIVLCVVAVLAVTGCLWYFKRVKIF